MNQLALTFEPHTHARLTDPDTSKSAAAQLQFASSHCGRILQALPGTLDSLALKTGLTSVQVARRLPDLLEAGLARPSGETRLSVAGRAERVWVKA